jgi:hypothetical protein
MGLMALPGRLYLDANILIHLLEGNDALGISAYRAFRSCLETKSPRNERTDAGRGLRRSDA